jgi:hypothetical protein
VVRRHREPWEAPPVILRSVGCSGIPLDGLPGMAAHAKVNQMVRALPAEYALHACPAAATAAER